MDITWYGHSCFRMIERGSASIVTDPFDESIGYAIPKLKADIVSISHEAPGHSAIDVVRGAELVLDRPGEYEIGGVFVTGVATFDETRPPEELRRNIVFVYTFSSVTVCHLGDLDYIPQQKEIEALGSIDVLLVPVGGGGALNASQASDVISLIEPRIVVPMHYHTDQTTADLEPLDRFISEMGLQSIEETDLLRVNRSSLSGDDTEVVILTVSE